MIGIGDGYFIGKNIASNKFVGVLQRRKNLYLYVEALGGGGGNVSTFNHSECVWPIGVINI